MVVIMMFWLLCIGVDMFVMLGLCLVMFCVQLCWYILVSVWVLNIVFGNMVVWVVVLVWVSNILVFEFVVIGNCVLIGIVL